MRNTTIRKHLFTTILISALAFSAIPSQSAMTPEAGALYQEACSAEHQQDLRGAISKLEKAIELSGPDITIYTKLAGIYSEIDEFDKALETYKEVIKLKPDDAFIYISIGSIYENKGNYKEALVAYTKALETFPEYKYNYFNIANVQYQLRLYNKAIQNYNLFLETYTQHTEARENLASSYSAIKDYKNAVTQYKTIYDKDPENFKNFSEYGIALLNTENAEKAVEMLERAIEKDPENTSAHLGLAQAYQDLGKKELSYEQYQLVLSKVPNLNTVRLDYANLLANMSKNTEAIEQYNMFIKAYPNDVRGYKNIALVYKELGNFDKAIENYLIAINKDGEDINLKIDVANCYHNKKDYSNALKYYNEILEKQPDSYEIKVNKAIALHALKKYDDAITLYEELYNVKKDKTLKDNLNNALIARGHDRIKNNNYGTAIEDFTTALKGGSADSLAYYGLAKAYQATGDNSKASENYEKAISIDPDKTLYSSEYSEFISSLYSPKGSDEDSASEKTEELPSINLTLENTEEIKVQEVKQPEKPHVEEKQSTPPVTIKENKDFIDEGDKNYKENNYDAAIKNYQDALQLVPNDAVTLLKLGNIYNKVKNDNEKAINYYQKSIIVNPEYTDGWFNLGLSYANENNLIESQKSFEKVISLDPNYNLGYAYYALGMALEHQGKKSEAVKNYKLFIKHNNDNTTINTVQEKIKELSK